MAGPEAERNRTAVSKHLRRQFRKLNRGVSPLQIRSDRILQLNADDGSDAALIFDLLYERGEDAAMIAMRHAASEARAILKPQAAEIKHLTAEAVDKALADYAARVAA